MCGRFLRYATLAAYRDLFGLASLPDLPPSFNIAPTQNVLVARARDGIREGVAMRWGLIPSWAKDKKKLLINARAENVAAQPAFRSAFKKRRCLILADGFYEWKTLAPKKKLPYLFRLSSGAPLAFAGLWEAWHGAGDPLLSCAIITTEANALTRPIHDRMPVILCGADADAWIDPSVEDAAQLLPLLRPFPAEGMVAFPVSDRVNKVSENDAELVLEATNV